uniref:F-box domain-containing protein n=1 Tax=Timema tahoe TaxID=61484 RepID=A0A7R9ILX2_9NEOP|nr:unnamed protein product [Timema tahoe]
MCCITHQQLCRCVDSNSLVSAALVCKKWRNICRSDTSLRIAIRRQLRRDRLGPTALRTRDTNAQATRVRRNSDKEQIPVKIDVEIENDDEPTTSRMNRSHRMTTYPLIHTLTSKVSTPKQSTASSPSLRLRM